MHRNVEIKVRISDLAAMQQQAAKLADGPPLVLQQEDTFFRGVRGRLKLRQLSGLSEAELIYYERPDESGPKESRYLVHRTSDAQGLRAVLSAALGVRAVVHKRRTLYLIGQTRLHLDEVEHLGEFVEIEVVLQAHQDVSEGVAIAQRIMDQLGIDQTQLIDRAYVDLLEPP